MAHLPNPLFKYCDPRGVDILKNCRLKVTPFIEFNDPFELAPRMRSDFPLEDASKAIDDPELLWKLYELSVLQGHVPIGSFDAFARLVSTVKPDLAAKMVADYAEDAARFRVNHLPQISSEFGLVCVSETADDILMWSHYTKGHTGIVIAFDTTHGFFTHPPVHQVEYHDERVLMGHWADLRDAPHRADVIESLIKTKARPWSYEKEWRQLHFLANCPAPEITPEGKKLYFKALDPKEISQVICGCRCDSRKVKNALSGAEFENVKLLQARVHETEFKLVFEAV